MITVKMKERTLLQQIMFRADKWPLLNNSHQLMTVENITCRRLSSYYCFSKTELAKVLKDLGQNVCETEHTLLNAEVSQAIY